MKRFCLTVLLSVCAASADVRLPAVISDHMLVQRGVPVSIFGWADAGEAVTVQFRGQTVGVTADARGRWQAWLKPMEAAATGADLKVSGRNSLTVSDVLVGEVWVGSGQSNMVWPVRSSVNADGEAAKANYPQIRLFQVALKTSDAPLDDVEGKWMVCSPETVKGFSGVGYFFARHLHEKLRAPIGVIQSAWGGTPAQAWTSKHALNADPVLAPHLAQWNQILFDYPAATERYQKQLAGWDDDVKKAASEGRRTPARPRPPMGPGHSHTPAGLYNAMIHPLLKYTIQGAIWYQGESNANAAQSKMYHRLFTTMIQDWRRAWGQGEFPFLFVQLANFNAGSREDWVLVQEAQDRTLELRKTGMAVINDIGEPGDIHPKNKQDVGTRLALAARHIAYGEQLVYSGPRFRQATAEGGKLRLWFTSTGGGLKARSGELKGFEVAGADGVYQAASASVDGTSVVVSSPSVTSPVMARYAWSDNPDANLVNAEGLAASVFRTRP